jgi:hypothetical protein
MAFIRTSLFLFTNEMAFSGKHFAYASSALGMTIPNDNLRLFLVSLNELKQVAILAAANDFGPQLSSMGIVKGKQQLESFLVMAGIDHYTVSYGEPFATTFKSTAFVHSPKQIVRDLERGFQQADELRLKLRKGETLTDEEQSHLRFLPKSWSVCSSSVTTNEGIERIRSWFKANKVK